jgi:hypothetical protein
VNLATFIFFKTKKYFLKIKILLELTGMKRKSFTLTGGDILGQTGSFLSAGNLTPLEISTNKLRDLPKGQGHLQIKGAQLATALATFLGS